MSDPRRDEIRSPELLSTRRGRLAVAGFVVLCVAVVAIAALRPDRQGVGTPNVPEQPPAASPSAASPSVAPPPLTRYRLRGEFQPVTHLEGLPG